MINRILIRTKVVQMLYSYLLTRSEFRIDSAPENGSKDKRYAYAVYSDLLILIQELSGCRIARNKKQPRVDVDPKLARNRVGKALADNDTVKQMVLRGAVDTSKFDALLQPLLDRITDSAAFRDYKKIKAPALADDVRFWLTILSTVIAKDDAFKALMHEDAEFTTVGFNAGIRQMADTLTSYQDSRLAYINAGKELKASLDKAYELYNSLFVLMMELTHEQYTRLEECQDKASCHSRGA